MQQIILVKIKIIGKPYENFWRLSYHDHDFTILVV